VVGPQQILTPASGSIVQVLQRPEVEGKLEIEVEFDLV
jgi:hypothetical protein